MTGIGLCGVLLPLIVVVSVGQALAQEPAGVEPLYPEYIMPADDSFSGDAALTAFRLAAMKVRETLTTDADGNKVFDPTAMLPFLAEKSRFWSRRATASSTTNSARLAGTIPRSRWRSPAVSTTGISASILLSASAMA